MTQRRVNLAETLRKSEAVLLDFTDQIGNVVLQDYQALDHVLTDLPKFIKAVREHPDLFAAIDQKVNEGPSQ